MADIQEQLSSGGEAADQAALLKEQRALLADMQKKEAELQQEKMKQAELIITVIELDRECMKALVRRNYLLGRKMPLARAYKSFLEQLGPVKKAWEDGTVESLRQKSVLTAEELEHTQTVLRSLAEQLRQNEG